jgi:hypothetical protein
MYCSRPVGKAKCRWIGAVTRCEKTARDCRMEKLALDWIIWGRRIVGVEDRNWAVIP